MTLGPARIFRTRQCFRRGQKREVAKTHEEFVTELTRLSLAWHIPEITHPDVPALDLLSTILGDGRSSRLYRQLREESLGLEDVCLAAAVPEQSVVLKYGSAKSIT